MICKTIRCTNEITQLTMNDKRYIQLKHFHHATITGNRSSLYHEKTLYYSFNESTESKGHPLDLTLT